MSHPTAAPRGIIIGLAIATPFWGGIGYTAARLFGWA